MPFVGGEARDDAWAALEAWLASVRRWQDEEGKSEVSGSPNIVALTGAEGVGKTRLAESWQASLADYPIKIVDDADAYAPLDLFAIINEAITSRQPLVLIGRARPVTWVRDETAPGAPDLISRLASLTRIELEGPDQESIQKALQAGLLQVGLDLPEAQVRQAAHRLCRRFSAVRDVVLSAARLSGSIAAAKPLLEAAIADNPRHCLS